MNPSQRADIQVRLAKLEVVKARLPELKELADRVAREHKEHVEAIAEERAALMDLFRILLAPYKQKHRVQIVEALYEEIARESEGK